MATRWPQAKGVRASFCFVVALGALLVCSRWFLAPRYLYYFDSVNFALALEEFDPAQHQPQPPGYPLFVVVTRVLHWLVPAPEQTFLLAGILVSAAAMLLLFKTAARLFSPPVALIAVLLLLFNPAFWLGGITNQVRVCLAAGSCAVALLAWRSLEPEAPARWLYATAAALGIAAGFRPALLLLLFPLLLYAGLRARRSPHQWLLAGLVLTACVVPWAAFTIYASGGPRHFLQALLDYSQTQFSPTSALFGADAPSAWRMAKMAVIWNGLGVLSWIWALPLLWRRPALPLLRNAAVFLLVWFLPAFLFHALVHVGDPDHTLVTAPILCLVGGVLLSQIGAQAGRRARQRMACAVAAAVALNVVLFLRPLPGVARACSYPAVRNLDVTVSTTFQSIRELRRGRPITLVSYHSLVTWRHLSYYFRETRLFVLNAPPDRDPDPATVWTMRNLQGAAPRVENGEILLRPNRRVIWLMRPQRRALLAPATAVKRYGPLLFLDVRPGMRFQFGGYRFATLPLAAANVSRSSVTP